MRATSGSTGTTSPGGSACLIGFFALTGEGDGDGAAAVLDFVGVFLGFVGEGAIGLFLLVKPP